MENYTQEELEYRRYLRKRIRQRRRRRKVMIARAIVGCVAIALVVGFFGIIKVVVGSLSNQNAKNRAAVVAERERPTATPFKVMIPEGYETLYNQLVMLRDTYSEMDEILMNLSQYPKDILELAVKNQETIPFVAGYPKNHGEKKAGKINAEELGEGIPLFMQWDERWGYMSYGGNIIAISGCGPTCMSMVYSGLTGKKDMSPADMATYCMDNDYYKSESGTSWTMMSEGAVNLGLGAEKITVSEEVLRTELEAGHPIICSMAPGDFTSEGHFIVLTGLDEKGQILVNDPNSIERSEKTWDFETVLPQIKAAWSYSLT